MLQKPFQPFLFFPFRRSEAQERARKGLGKVPWSTARYSGRHPRKCDTFQPMRTHTHRCDHCGDRHLCRIPAWLPPEEVPRDVEGPVPAPAAPAEPVSRWLEQRTQPDGGWTSASSLHADYVTWCMDTGSQPVGTKRFAQALLAFGVQNKRSNGIFYQRTLLSSREADGR